MDYQSIKAGMERTMRVRYYCNSHGCMTVRRGRFVRTFLSRGGREVTAR